MVLIFLIFMRVGEFFLLRSETSCSIIFPGHSLLDEVIFSSNSGQRTCRSTLKSAGARVLVGYHGHSYEIAMIILAENYELLSLFDSE